MSRGWNDEETEILMREYPRGGSNAVRLCLPHKSATAIQKRANLAGIRIGRGNVKPMVLYPDPQPEVAAALRAWRGARPGQLQGRAW